MRGPQWICTTIEAVEAYKHQRHIEVNNMTADVQGYEEIPRNIQKQKRQQHNRFIQDSGWWKWWGYRAMIMEATKSQDGYKSGIDTE